MKAKPPLMRRAMAKIKNKPAELDERDRVILMAAMLDSDADDLSYAEFEPETMPIPKEFMMDRQRWASRKLREQADLVLRVQGIVKAHYRCGNDACAHWAGLRGALNV